MPEPRVEPWEPPAAYAMTASAERSAAATLQHSLLPEQVPNVPGFALAARYIPGGDSGVGGDWYDVFTLPSGRVGMAIGDVAGHGLRAAVIMGRLRSALRAYALETEDPADVLSRLDRKMTHFEPDAMATVGYAVLDPGTNALTLSAAGHPPPAYASQGTPAALLDVRPDLPIGTGIGPYRRRIWDLLLRPGDVVCLYTDGLVERRDAGIDDGLARLCDAVDPAPASRVSARVTDNLLAGREPEDDVALVVLSRDRP